MGYWFALPYFAKISGRRNIELAGDELDTFNAIRYATYGMPPRPEDTGACADEFPTCYKLYLRPWLDHVQRFRGNSAHSIGGVAVMSDRGPNSNDGFAGRRTRYNTGDRFATGQPATPWKWRGAASVFEDIDVWKSIGGWWSAGRGYRLIRWRVADCETGVSAGGQPILVMTDSLFLGATSNIGSGELRTRAYVDTPWHPVTGFRFYDRGGPMVIRDSTFVDFQNDAVQRRSALGHLQNEVQCCSRMLSNPLL